MSDIKRILNQEPFNNMAVNPQLQGAVLTLAVVFGVLGNLPVIVSICRKRSLLKNIYYYLILHLAICDVFYLLFFIPDIHSVFNASPAIISRFHVLCKIWWPTHTLFFTAGANFLVLISMLRYRAIVHPLKPAVGRKTLKIISACIYVLATICAIPYVLVLRFDKTIGCYLKWPMESLDVVYSVFLAGIQYFIPVAFLSMIYFKIGKEVLTRNNRFHEMEASTQSQCQISGTTPRKQRIKKVKPLLVSFTIVACFIVSGFPAQILHIAFLIMAKERPSYFLLCEALYLFGTAVINPYVYGALDKKIFSFLQHCRKKRTNRY